MTELFGGRYELLRRLDSGGMAEVYLARQRGAAGFERHVVVKRILPHLASEPEFVEMFLDEARMAADLRHPNIVSTLDLGEDDGQYFIVLEYLEGCSVRRLTGGIDRAGFGRLPLAHAVSIVADAARGLHHAHTKTDTQGRPLGLVHRDISPENLFVTRQGDTRVLDFGIATAGIKSSRTSPSTLKGKLAYLSPEQARGEEVDGRSDQFSLALVAFELAVGARAYRGGTDVELYASAVSGTLAAGELGGISSAGLRDVLERALSVNRNDRFATSADFTLALEALDFEAPPLSLAEYVRVATMALAASRSSSEMMTPSGPVGQVSRTAATRASAEARVLHTPSIARTNASNLPTDSTAFIGRRSELAELRKLWAAGHQLITLRGTAGAGKTRLALELGSELSRSGALAGGVWFCDLTEATTASGICHVIGRALGIPLDDASSGAAVDRLKSSLSARGATLLIVDNFEQVVGQASSTVGQWLDDSPELRVLCTTREPLEIRDEVVVELHPLSTDPADDDIAEAVELFLERARVAAPNRSIDRSSPEIAEIVRKLDGLPLAIELAAARLNVLTPSQVLERLDRIDLLRRRKGGPKKQATLRGALDWSWDLLDPQERSALAQCSVFRDGFTLEAGEAVIALPAADHDPLVADALESLREKSLLRLDDKTMRFSMLETTRAYARERLEESDDAGSASERHGDYYSGLAEILGARADREIEGYLSPEIEQLAVEMENLLAAFDAAVVVKRPGVALHAAHAVALVLRELGPFERARPMLEQAIELASGSDPKPKAVIRALIIRAWLEERSVGVIESLAWFERALAFATGSDETELELEVRFRITNALIQSDQPDAAREQLEEVNRIIASLEGNPQPLWDLQIRARLLFREVQTVSESRRDDAVELCQQGLELSRERRLRSWELGFLSTLGNVSRGNDAVALFEQVLAIRPNHVKTLYNIAVIYMEMGDRAAAVRSLERTVQIGERVGERKYVVLALGGLGDNLFELGDYEGSRELFRATESDVYQLAGRMHGVGHSVIFAACDAALGKLEEAETRMVEAKEVATSAGFSRMLDGIELLEVFFDIGRAKLDPDNAATHHATAKERLDAAAHRDIGDWAKTVLRWATGALARETS